MQDGIQNAFLTKVKNMKDIIEIKVNDFGAKPDEVTICTEAIQKAIDEASALNGGRVVFEKGVYLTGAIFLKSNVELHIGEGVELKGVMDENAYPERWSRVAGVEMNWPSGLINIFNEQNTKITGKGLINGQGKYWWNRYWGEDKLGGIRKVYTAKGLRWAVDYDCKRPRNILVMNSSEILLEGITLKNSPFWNVHICYSSKVKIDGLNILENRGPSTDGIDIDSSNDVLVENCYVECNDDNLCVKAGRDADGLRVNRPCENIIIRNCELGAGAGITLGSETSGGIRNVEIYNIKAKGTNNGFRLKSARTRGGLIENIKVHDFEMIDVPNPFSFLLNWNPSYSYCEMPKDWEGGIPEHWKVLAEPVAPERGLPEFRNIEISDITVKSVFYGEAENKIGKGKASKAFEVEAYEEKPINQIHWHNIVMETNTAGSIENAKDWTMENVTIYTLDSEPIQLKNCINVQLPNRVKLTNSKC